MSFYSGHIILYEESGFGPGIVVGSSVSASMTALNMVAETDNSLNAEISASQLTAEFQAELVAELGIIK